MRIRMLRRVLAAALAIFVSVGASAPAQAAECADLWDWLNKACRTLVDTYDKGGNEVIVSGYTWHTPWTWTAEKRAEENSNAWGGGWARTVEHENGNTDTVFALVFSDSHEKPEYNLGYVWTTYWGPRSFIQPGLGYTAAIIARSDLANGWPFPVVLPVLSLRYDRVTVQGVYIPNLGGGVNHGSVFYFYGRIGLD